MARAEQPAGPPVDKQAARVRAMFAAVARRYDLLNHLLSLNIDKRWRRFVVRTVAPTGCGPILDVCTGTADLALGYAAAQPGVHVWGADFCHEMLVVGARKVARSGGRVTLVEADALRLPFASATFEVVSVAFGLRNVSDPAGGVAEMVRVLAPGGRLAVLEFSRPRTPILRWLYLAYFRWLLPIIGQRVSKSPHAAYRYLPASVLQFPDGPELVRLLERAGLEKVTYHPLTFGIATLYVGHKP